MSKIIPDKLYLKIMYFKHFRKNLSFNKPETLNEKIQWLKINDVTDEYKHIVDKFKVREYIANEIGEEYLIPLIGVWNSVDEINYEELPNQFVLKCNHDSKSVFICKDKESFDFDSVKKEITKKLKLNGYWYGREKQYKNIHPLIIAEKYMVDESQVELKDYKIMCFNGKADNIMVCHNREKDGAEYKFFDLQWKPLPYNKENNLEENSQIPKPKSLKKMIEIAEKLSHKYLFARVDLYNISGKIYFGEITFHPASGFDKDISTDTDLLFGKKLKLPIDL
ncbi:ATP-grasp fold amidoligase family protein [Paraclostridium sordellii]|uniref:ATP-grasp fold amidoligase family protein n=1 Tax=Paraclostridium sordellii TaxID=1505 RepID=UPI0018C2A867|nr:ATP-grasp fold amidoligase family protein [Paeniclostridium sordellii]